MNFEKDTPRASRESPVAACAHASPACGALDARRNLPSRGWGARATLDPGLLLLLGLLLDAGEDGRHRRAPLAVGGEPLGAFDAGVEVVVRKPNLAAEDLV